MSLFFKSLPWLIPQLALTARSKSELVIMSPWIEEVRFDSPLLAHLTHRVTLSGLLDVLAAREVSITLLIRDHDKRLNRVLRAVTPETRKGIQIRSVAHTHTKAFVTEELALHSSANLLPTSYHRNKENPITLETNIHGSAKRWLRHQQDITY